MSKDAHKTITIDGIADSSIAEEAGIEPGDMLLSVNGSVPQDIFDYRMLAESSSLALDIKKKNGGFIRLDIEKDEEEDIGLMFDDPLFDGTRRCRNKCIFCFVDQLPAKMRKTLYFKDDDFRLSFISGNYITLTNMDDRDMERIITYRMTPVNISVHSTDPAIRRLMLGNSLGGDVLEKIRLFCQAGIDVNCQIVLCRGVNDGAVLEKTLSDLTLPVTLVNSISIVPSGLTKHRQSLYPLIPYDKDSAYGVLNTVHAWQGRLLDHFGSRTVYAADEFYLLGGVPIPRHEEYEGFPQLENGVGMVSLIKHEFDEAMSMLRKSIQSGHRRNSEHGIKPLKENKGIEKGEKGEKRVISIITGTAAYDLISGFASEICSISAFSEMIEINVFGITNDFFGDTVTVSGLVTGGDIVAQLKGKKLGDELLIPASMLKSGEDVLLDDCSLSMLQECLGVKVKPVASGGSELLLAALGPLTDRYVDTTAS